MSCGLIALQCGALLCVHWLQGVARFTSIARLAPQLLTISWNLVSFAAYWYSTLSSEVQRLTSFVSDTTGKWMYNLKDISPQQTIFPYAHSFGGCDSFSDTDPAARGGRGGHVCGGAPRDGRLLGPGEHPPGAGAQHGGRHAGRLGQHDRLLAAPPDERPRRPSGTAGTTYPTCPAFPYMQAIVTPIDAQYIWVSKGFAGFEVLLEYTLSECA
eukprot:scaffold244454_cov38-Prasinocladus_malaysianus.AAC.1